MFTGAQSSGSSDRAGITPGSHPGELCRFLALIKSCFWHRNRTQRGKKNPSKTTGRLLRNRASKKRVNEETHQIPTGLVRILYVGLCSFLPLHPHISCIKYIISESPSSKLLFWLNPCFLGNTIWLFVILETDEEEA